MSSFDITNINSFNDLINRAEILEEKDALSRYKQMVRQRVGPKVRAYVDTKGGQVPAKSRIKNIMMIRALFNLNVINGAESEKLYRLANSSTKIIKYLNEKDPDYFLSDRAEELDKYIEAESDALIEFALRNNTLAGKGEGFTKREVEQIKAADPDALADKLSDEIGADIDEVMLVKGLMNRVLNDIKQNLGEEGFDISDQALDQVVDYSEKINTVNQLESFVRQIANEPGYEKIAAYLSTIIKPAKAQVAVKSDQEDPHIAAMARDASDVTGDDYEEQQKAEAAAAASDEEKKAKKDYDGDGKIESGEKEYMGSRDRAIKKAMGSSMKESKEYVAQPHLEVSETSTANYLTEQAASDKRNKKTEVKNQSFKERYKPKTQWQLEELRRYGL